MLGGSTSVSGRVTARRPLAVCQYVSLPSSDSPNRSNSAMTFCVAALTASRVRSPSSSSWRDTSRWMWAATSSFVRSCSSRFASRTAARRSLVAACASRIISRHSAVAASSRSSSLTAASSLIGWAWGSPQSGSVTDLSATRRRRAGGSSPPFDALLVRRVRWERSRLTSSSGRGGEAVAGPAHRSQASGTVTELAAERTDHDLDDVAAAAPVVAPYVAQQGRPADDPAFAFVQVLQYVEFELGEIRAGAVEDELAAVGIEEGAVIDEHFPRGEVGQPAVDGGRPEVVVDGVVGGPPDLGGPIREWSEPERRELGQRHGEVCSQ